MKARRIGQSHTIHLEWHFKSPNIFVDSRDHTRVIWKTKLCCVYINNMIDPTNDPWTSFLIPFINLHCTLLHQMNMHLQSIPQHMRFMSHFHGKYIHPKHDHNTVTIRDSLSIYILEEEEEENPSLTSWSISLKSGWAHFSMMRGARSRGASPRRSASPWCSVKQCSSNTRPWEKQQMKQHTSLVNMGSKRNDTAYTGCIRLGRTTDPSSQIESFKTPFDYLEGVCLIGNLAFLKKSAEPPIPFNILEPSAQVELACPY